MHTQYGNGQPRPLLRGWLHFVVILAIEGALAVAFLPAGTASLLRWSSIGFYGSFLFHMLPWSSPKTYQIALAADFLAIRCATSSEIDLEALQCEDSRRALSFVAPGRRILNQVETLAYSSTPLPTRSQFEYDGTGCILGGTRGMGCSGFGLCGVLSGYSFTQRDVRVPQILSLAPCS